MFDRRRKNITPSAVTEIDQKSCLNVRRYYSIRNPIFILRQQTFLLREDASPFGKFYWEWIRYFDA